MLPSTNLQTHTLAEAASFHPPPTSPIPSSSGTHSRLFIPLYYSHYEQLEGRDMSEFCLGPQPPTEGLEHSQPPGLARQPQEANNPSHTGVHEAYSKPSPAQTAPTPSKPRGTLFAIFTLGTKSIFLSARSHTGTGSDHCCPLGVQMTSPPLVFSTFRELSSWSGPGTTPTRQVH